MTLRRKLIVRRILRNTVTLTTPLTMRTIGQTLSRKCSIKIRKKTKIWGRVEPSLRATRARWARPQCLICRTQSRRCSKTKKSNSTKQWSSTILNNKNWTARNKFMTNKWRSSRLTKRSSMYKGNDKKSNLIKWKMKRCLKWSRKRESSSRDRRMSPWQTRQASVIRMRLSHYESSWRPWRMNWRKRKSIVRRKSIVSTER